MPELPGGGPRYRALADEIGLAVDEGRLAPGEKLPPVRDLAWRLKVTPGTVARAYRLAEQRGLLDGQIGRGTFVRASRASGPEPRSPAGASSPGLADLQRNFAPDVGQDAVITDALRRLIDRAGALPFTGYGGYDDDRAERAAFAEWLRSGGVRAPVDDIVLTGGAQLGVLTALASTIGGRDASALTEEMIYPGVKDCARVLGMRLEPVATDRDGLVPEALEESIARHRPGAIMLSANVQNPTLAHMPLARRERVAEIALARRVAIIEDDVYGWLIPAARAPSFVDLAPEQSWLVASLSKCASAGLRAGCVVAPPGRGLKAARMLKSFVQNPPRLTALLVAELIRSGELERIIARVRAEFADRRILAETLLLGAAARNGGVLHLREDGPFGWLTLPEPWRASEFEIAAQRRGVSLLTAEQFAVGRASAPHAVRIALGGSTDRSALSRALEALAGQLDSPPAPTSASA